MVCRPGELLQLLNSCNFWDAPAEFLSLKLTVPLVNDDVTVGFPGWNHRHNMFGVRGHDIQDVAFIGIQHALQRRPEIFLINDPFALHSESATELDVIRVDPISISRITKNVWPRLLL